MHALNPVQRIGEQIAEPVVVHGQATEREAVVRAGALLEQVGLPSRRLNDYPHELSGGQRQRVMIAMALACSPSLIIADEPTTALDVMVQAQVLRLLKQLQRDLGLAMIFITHDLSVLVETCDRLEHHVRGPDRGGGTVRGRLPSPLAPVHRGPGRCLPGDRRQPVPQGAVGSAGRPAVPVGPPERVRVPPSMPAGVRPLPRDRPVALPSVRGSASGMPPRGRRPRGCRSTRSSPGSEDVRPGVAEADT